MANADNASALTQAPPISNGLYLCEKSVHDFWDNALLRYNIPSGLNQFHAKAQTGKESS